MKFLNKMKKNVYIIHYCYCYKKNKKRYQMYE
jgi:hypothetical protein